MNIPRTSLTTALCVLITASAWAETLRVGPGRTIKKIQSAVTAASAGDRILIDAGTYVENIEVSTQDLVIRPARKGKKGRVTIDGNGSTPLYFKMGSDRSRVKDLHFTNCGNYGVLVAGLSFVSAIEGVRITRCTIDESTVDAGIKVKWARDTVVSKCKVLGGQTYGIQVEQSPGSAIVKCKVMDLEEDGIVIQSDEITVSKNKILRGEGCGIRLGTFTKGSSLCLVSGNKVDTPYYGIYIEDPSSHCVLQGNVIRKSDDGYGIDLWRTENHLIAENKVVSGRDGGIHLGQCSDVDLYRNVSKNNVGDNFYCWDGTRITFVKNRSLNGYNDGFYVDGDSNTLVKNSARGAADSGFEISGEYHVVTGNKSRKNNRSGSSYKCDFDASGSLFCFFKGNKYKTSKF